MKTFALYANPESGGMRGRRGERVRNALERAGLTDPPADIREGINPPFGTERVLLLGGDGTLHHALPRLLELGLPVAIIPAGTGNDFARSLSLPLELDDALKVAMEGPLHPVDIGFANDTPFLCAASFGLDAEIAARTREGKAGAFDYIWKSLSALLRFRPRNVQVTWDSGEYSGPITLVTAANGSRYGNNMKIAPDARMDDGLLELLIVKALPKHTLIRLFVALISGNTPTHPALIRARTKSVRVDGRAKGSVYADGEPAAEVPLNVRVAAGALAVARSPLT